METYPEVSVCVLTYNHENYVREALDSIINQKTTFYYEILVFDDASLDDTVEIIREEYGDRVKLNVHEKNLGISRNVYDACKMAKGKYLAFLAGDDYVLTEDYLQIHYDCMSDNDGFAGVSHGMKIVDEDGKELDCFLCDKDKYTLYDFLWSYYPGIPYGCFLKNIFTSANLDWLYTVSRDNNEFTFPLYVYLHGDIKIIGKYLHAYRCIQKKGEKNYNSLFDAVDTYCMADKAYNYIEKNIFKNIVLKYRLIAYEVDTAYVCLAQLIKKHSITLLKKWIRTCGWIPLIRGIVYASLLKFGHKNYPNWYKKRHSVIKKEGKKD